MPATPLTHVARRLFVNVEKECGDLAEDSMFLPTERYHDPAQYEKEIELIFHRVPLVVALSVDLREPGDYRALDIAGRSVLAVRGDDGVARAFVNACRHRGATVVCNGAGSARRFTCPYHAWSYDNQGALVGVPGRDSFGEIDVTGLVELPTQERVGMIFAVLRPDGDIDVDTWLGGMADALALMRLDELHRYEVTTTLDSPNWKIAADGYVDGYHIGYLHKNTIGLKSITNRNTYDAFNAHQRIGFATKATAGLRDQPEAEWDLVEVMSLVHYVFPNVSIAGGLGDALMMSRLSPGPTATQSRTTQFQYFRHPLVTDEDKAMAEDRRRMYESVVRDEDYITGFGITRALPAFGDDHFRFGQNEVGNQHLHGTIERLVTTGTT